MLKRIACGVVVALFVMVGPTVAGEEEESKQGKYCPRLKREPLVRSSSKALIGRRIKLRGWHLWQYHQRQQLFPSVYPKNS